MWFSFSRASECVRSPRRQPANTTTTTIIITTSTACQVERDLMRKKRKEDFWLFGHAMWLCDALFPREFKGREQRFSCTFWLGALFTKTFLNFWFRACAYTNSWVFLFCTGPLLGVVHILCRLTGSLWPSRREWPAQWKLSRYNSRALTITIMWRIKQQSTKEKTKKKWKNLSSYYVTNASWLRLELATVFTL